jgi:hypothetical protein
VAHSRATHNTGRLQLLPHTYRLDLGLLRGGARARGAIYYDTLDSAAAARCG